MEKMREILFRGKSLNHEGWEQGDLITSFGRTYIANTVGNNPNDWCEVNPESVGQFTGLLDKNGIKIFEGDVIVSDFGDGDPNVIKFGQYKVLDEFGSCNSIGFYFFPENEPFGETIHKNSLAYKVIGNIYDNPELITKQIIYERIHRQTS
jgi:uncharacterized phage protein (TIGR01671 family)